MGGDGGSEDDGDGEDSNASGSESFPSLGCHFCPCLRRIDGMAGWDARRSLRCCSSYALW